MEVIAHKIMSFYFILGLSLCLKRDFNLIILKKTKEVLLATLKE